jgi:probable rRNA maturation factor
MAKFSFHNHNIAFVLKQKRIISGWLNSIFVEEKKECNTVTFVFCDDEYLLKLNNEFLQHDTLTDIITFDYSEDGAIKGDIFISVDRVRENSVKYNVSFENELHRVMAHGVLHLLGYKDKNASQKEIMRNKEDFYLQKLNSIKY